MVGRNSSDLPPGFRFHPTDEELIMYYLRNQATSKPCPVAIIPEVDIYKFDPWELPEKAEFGENEWYFFTPRDRKYPNGVRPNRAAVSGYWKATGTDKAIYSGSKYVGVKKALVFYKGRPPKGIKTDWIMHEYRLIDHQSRLQTTNKQQNGSMRLDDWVLCRIYKKRNVARAPEPKVEESLPQVGTTINDAGSHQPKTLNFPRTCSISHLWELEYLGSISQLLSDNNNQYNPNTAPVVNNINSAGVSRPLEKVHHHHHQSGDVGAAPPQHHHQFTDSMKFQLNHPSSMILNQTNFVNTLYEFQ